VTSFTFFYVKDGCKTWSICDYVLAVHEEEWAVPNRIQRFRTMTNKCTIISQIITLLHVSTLSCHPQGACNQYLAKLHKYFTCSCWQYYQQLYV